MSDLESVISNSTDVREVERAAAVKTVEEGLKSVNACKVLKVSVAFVSKRKIILGVTQLNFNNPEGVE